PAASSSFVPSRVTPLVAMTRAVPAKPLSPMTRLELAAGEVWTDAVAHTVDAGLAGIECLAGIPGSAGATPIQNVGAYGQEVA
ncbi:FAD-binding protein, partial [Streptomyces torulosus]|uniref:FAD-binding protein n=1 Tax=Streptomyces torulosus TaxID=68276 RepID=UPI003B8304E4